MASPIAVLMSPGTYLRKRREAAGISLDLAAVAFVPWGRPAVVHQQWAVRPDDELLTMVRTVAARIDELEQDHWAVDSTFTAVLARIVPLDVEIYDRLLALRLGVDVPPPQICRECGWSWAIPATYRVESGIPGCFAEYAVMWSATDPELCTGCEHKAAVNASQLTEETSDAS